MQYLYYPGCSLEGTAKEYDQATRALLQRLEVRLTELEDWTCCGASAAPGISRLLALALAGRNLALAERAKIKADLLVPCSACYLNLKKTAETLRADPQAMRDTNDVLAEEGLSISGKIRVRHLLDVLSTDLGPPAIAGKVAFPLKDLVVAPYYGCQCLRPYPVFDDPQNPTSMEGLIRATGAEVLSWSMGPRCCGASHMTTHMDQGMQLSGAILAAARDADVIATVCPMCQLNLEGFQKQIARRTGQDEAKTVLYLPQLLGIALGIPPKELGLALNLAVTDAFKKRIAMNEDLSVMATQGPGTSRQPPGESGDGDEPISQRQTMGAPSS